VDPSPSLYGYIGVPRGYPPQGIRNRYCQIGELVACFFLFDEIGCLFGLADEFPIYSFAGSSVSSLCKLEVLSPCHLGVFTKRA
jgi:hypothetical protein